MGIDISTDKYGVKVWRSDKTRYPSYYIKISTKFDDKWFSETQAIKFRHGVELENGSEIYIDSAFDKLDVWKDRNGEYQQRRVWQITEFHYKTHQKEPYQDVFDNLPDSFAAAEEECPF